MPACRLAGQRPEFSAQEDPVDQLLLVGAEPEYTAVEKLLREAGAPPRRRAPVDS